MNDNIHHSTLRNTLSRWERLKKRSAIDTLFQHGKAFSFNHFRIVYHQLSLSADTTAMPASSVRIGVSVPKKHFKKATTRNLIKRRIKEQYRLRKNTLIHGLGYAVQLDFFIIYQHRELISSAAIGDAWDSIIAELIRRTAQRSTP